ncbi:MAG: glycosyltransferase [Limisphaerales bacterium]
MRILWLTKLLPYPSFSGDLIYSRHLIEGCVRLGLEMVVVCHRDGSAEHPAELPGLTWDVIETPSRSRLAAIFSNLPNIAARFAGASRLQVTMNRVKEGGWDGIVFDGLGALAFIDEIEAALPSLKPSPFVAYISHNHEETIRFATARVSSPAWYRAVQYADAFKTRWLERKAASLCDILSVVTEEDGLLFRKHNPHRRVEVISPGYAGIRKGPQSLAGRSRRVMVLGSFQWMAKRTNIESFLEAAAPILPTAAIACDVVGSMSEGYRQRLRRRFPWANIVGTVCSTAEPLALARIGIVPEQTGGGFKLKILNYAFARVPIIALETAMAGVPLKPARDFIAASSVDELVRLIVARIDDIAGLESMANSAFDACEAAFNWSDRCEKLVAAFGSPTNA